jgi:DNA-binding NarL/FixJ family response regulator
MPNAAGSASASTGRTRVLVADGHTMVRTAVCRLIDAEDDLQVVGQAGSGREAIRLSAELAPDVTVVELRLPDLDGLSIVRDIRRDAARTEVVAVSLFAHHEHLTRLVRAGAAGLVGKAARPEELLHAIRAASRHELFVATALLEQMTSARGPLPEDGMLTGPEQAVLTQMARGQASDAVALALQLRAEDVRAHRQRIVSKLGLRGEADLVRYAILRRLLVTPDR